MFERKLRKIARKLGFGRGFASETAKVRHLVLEYCQGYGCDIGFGGDKVKKQDCTGIDYAQPYTKTGQDSVDIACDVMKEKIPVPDDTFDYVYSSHMIEDVEDTASVLKEFIRILKPGGNLILVFPDQAKYEKTCRRTGQPLNMCHVHADMGLTYMHQQLRRISDITYSTLFESNCVIDYNVVMVLKITKENAR
jgi:ubiquinone/menaquinone biosynthesis C-methylase UbiE